MSEPIHQKVRTNAMIAYFFLGFMFLLARKNPDFSHPFVRSHAKSATKSHILWLGGFILYSFYLWEYIPNYAIPILPAITLDRVISMGFFLMLAVGIIRGAYLAHRGISTDEVSSSRLREAFARENTSLAGATETEKTVYMSSYIPLLGLVTAARHPNPITRTGAKMGAIWLLLMLLSQTIVWWSELGWILLFVYILYVTFVGVSLFLYDVVPGFAFTENIPELSSIYMAARAFFPYCTRLIAVIFGSKQELSYRAEINLAKKRESDYEELARTHLTDATLPFSRILIFIPILNLIFFPQIFIRKNSTHILAILQGLVITLGLIALWLTLGFSTPWQMFFLFAIFLGIAHVQANPFYKIPLVYEAYLILDFLTFGIGGKIGKLKEKHKETAKVSYKI